MIAAIQKDRGIGYQGKLIHNIKNDMAHFVKQTEGHVVIMGRKNWESIPKKYRPLSGRKNIVVTRDPSYQAIGAQVVDNIEAAIDQSGREQVFIIGGGELYHLALPYATDLDLTMIDKEEPADVFFPEFEDDFILSNSTDPLTDLASGTHYRFTTWRRKG